MKHLVMIVLLFLLKSLTQAAWNVENVSTTAGLYGITYKDSLFVVVGDSGTVLTSINGTLWESRPSVTSMRLYGVTSSPSLFVAVGDSSTILTSTDGATWHIAKTGGNEPLYAVTYNGSMFVAVGNAGTVLLSIDGITWTNETSGPENTLFSISWDGTRFWAGGYYLWAYNCYGIILSSLDGKNWEPHFDGTTKDALHTILTHDTLSFGLGRYGRMYHPSATGPQWQQDITGVTLATLNGSAILSNGTIVAVGSGGTIIFSKESTIWHSDTSGVTKELMAVASSATYVVAVGLGGTIVTQNLASTTPIVANRPLIKNNYGVSFRRVSTTTLHVTMANNGFMRGAIYSLSGEKLLQFSGRSTVKVSLAELAKGCYIAHVTNLQGISTSHLIGR